MLLFDKATLQKIIKYTGDYDGHLICKLKQSPKKR